MRNKLPEYPFRFPFCPVQVQAAEFSFEIKIVQVGKSFSQVNYFSGPGVFFNPAAAGRNMASTEQKIPGTDVVVIDQVGLMITEKPECPADQNFIDGCHNRRRCFTQQVAYPDIYDIPPDSQGVLNVFVGEIPDVELRGMINLPEAAID